MEKRKITVRLNGTDTNPYAAYGLTQNPFPAVATAASTPYILKLQSLGGEPIPDTDHIRKVLEGWDKEFVDYVCSKFKKGEIVKFDVEFPCP